MLTKCPECELQVSDKATTCPHCGYPLKYDTVRTRTQTRSKPTHKRLPNGFGQISKLNNKALRKPYRAMVTVGKNPDTGRPICKLLKPNAYFATYNEAYTALMEYNRNPYDLSKLMSVEDLYEEWSKWYFPVLTPSAIENHTTAWNYSKQIYSMKVAEVRVRHIRDVIDSCDKAYAKSRIKSLFVLMFDYAVEHEYTDQNYAKLLKLDPIVSKELNSVKKEHIAFTEAELNILWFNVFTTKYVDWILIQCYMGLRPRELLGILVENVDLENDVITCGMKTEAGKNRVVPIHEKIKKLVEMKIKVAKALDSPYLFNQPMSHGMSYTTYKKYFYNVMVELNITTDHRPHDPRKTFVTMAKKWDVDEYAIKRIIGHAIGDITERIYTQRDIEWLKSEMAKIKEGTGIPM